MSVTISRLAFAGAMLARTASAEVTEGSVTVPAHRMVFLHKFCYDYNADPGRVGQWEATLRSDSGGDMDLVLFDDQASSLPDSSHIDWNFQCGGERLISTSRGITHLNGTQMNTFEGMEIRDRGIIQHIRPRWWYVAVVDCSGEDRRLDYTLHMWNVKQGWQGELSMDRCGLPVLAAFFVAFSALLSVQAFTRTMTTSACVRHPLRTCLAASLAAASVGSGLQLLNGCLLARNGHELRSLYVEGKLCKWTSKLLLTCAIMLVSRGHGISHPLRSQHLFRAFRLLAPLFLGCCVLDVAGECAQSRKYTTDSVFVSWYGAALVGLDACMLLCYLSNLLRVLSRETDEVKRRFYAMWGPAYSLAFCILPAATVVAAKVSSWVEVKVVFILTNAVHLSLLAVLVSSLWPERSLRAFCIDCEELCETYGLGSDLLPSLLSVKGLDVDKPVEMPGRRLQQSAPPPLHV